jgi:hypothetical protein
MPMLGAVEYTTPDPGRRIALFIGCGANMTALELPRISPSLRLGKRALNVHQRLLCVKKYFTLSASVIAQPQVMKPSKTMTVREAAPSGTTHGLTFWKGGAECSICGWSR